MSHHTLPLTPKQGSNVNRYLQKMVASFESSLKVGEIPQFYLELKKMLLQMVFTATKSKLYWVKLSMDSDMLTIIAIGSEDKIL